MIACDTSAVAKFYVPEADSVAVRRILEDADQVCVSELMRPELMSVFHRRLREGTWSRRFFLAAIRQFQHDDLAGFWAWMPVDGSVLKAAAAAFATLPPTVFLRSSDCIHLITALQNGFTDFFTFDAHQTRAAAALGLTVVTKWPAHRHRPKGA
jgi:predicted nucleic acid-binding protein